ncbi:hypothetical protein FQA47_016098 [Oryzias melastigma]|uniref:Uncharacterized protein n=1 Tax=Oryzias melastigma TaxID=30732 RepID=A0A834KYX6_ORYME|nr:hypothetical protein FQA47_016098 [Oryzias melastigma]
MVGLGLEGQLRPRRVSVGLEDQLRPRRVSVGLEDQFRPRRTIGRRPAPLERTPGPIPGLERENLTEPDPLACELGGRLEEPSVLELKPSVLVKKHGFGSWTVRTGMWAWLYSFYSSTAGHLSLKLNTNNSSISPTTSFLPSNARRADAGATSRGFEVTGPAEETETPSNEQRNAAFKAERRRSRRSISLASSQQNFTSAQ